MNDQMRQEFNRIMGLGSMPPDGTSEYDEWLFERSYAAGRSDMADEAAQEVKARQPLFRNHRLCDVMAAAILQRKEAK